MIRYNISAAYLLPLSHDAKLSVNASVMNEFEGNAGDSKTTANQSITVGGGLYLTPSNELLVSVVGGYYYSPGFKIKDGDGNTEISYDKFSSPLIALEMAFSF